jgi:Pectate lyase superfamily protein
MPIDASKPTQWPLTPVETITSRPPGKDSSFGDKTCSILNVKDFGAVGDGSTDDSAAIQACFDAAFGPQSNPHGQTGGFANVPVFIPAGHYLIGTTLFVNHAEGAWVFGAGCESTRLTYTGPFPGLQAPSPPNINTDPRSGVTFTSVIHLNGGHFCLFEGFSIEITDPGNRSTFCFNVRSDANAITEDGPFKSYGNSFANMAFYAGSIGVALGALSVMCSENSFYNCSFNNHGYAGISINGGNCLGNVAISCQFNNCYMGIRENQGDIVLILGCTFKNTHYRDLDLGYGDALAIMGCASRTTAPYNTQEGYNEPGPGFLWGGGWGCYISDCSFYSTAAETDNRIRFFVFHGNGVVDNCWSNGGVYVQGGKAALRANAITGSITVDPSGGAFIVENI